MAETMVGLIAEIGGGLILTLSVLRAIDNFLQFRGKLSIGIPSPGRSGVCLRKMEEILLRIKGLVLGVACYAPYSHTVVVLSMMILHSVPLQMITFRRAIH